MPEEEEVEEEVKKVPKKKVKTEAKSSVRTYKHGIEAEKQKMGDYSKKFGTTVRSLQADFKKHSKDLKAAALNMREEGIKNMNSKTNTFKGEIKAATKKMNDGVDKFKAGVNDQIRENKEAVAKIEAGVKFLNSETNKMKKDFQAYARGPFTNYIKAFWG